MNEKQCKYVVDTGNPESRFDAVRNCVGDTGHEGPHVDGYGNRWEGKNWYIPFCCHYGYHPHDE